MKKILSISAILVAMTNGASCGVFTSIQSVMDPKVSPEPFQLDVYGWNARGYVFSVPKSNRECVIIFTESEAKSPVMQCYKK